MSSNFKEIQYSFANYIRNPEKNSIPEGIDSRRMGIYTELFFNNVNSFMSSAFPVIRSIYSDENWNGLIRDYFAKHKAHTPHFPEMSNEFLDYLQNEFQPRECDPPFLLDLAHYERVEMDVMLSQDNIDDVSYNPNGDLMKDAVQVSPLAFLLCYEWPVHELSKGFQPQEKPIEPTWIVIYRDLKDEVGFMHLNPITARLIQLLDEDNSPLSGEQALTIIAVELNHPNPEVILKGGIDILTQLKEKDIILGTHC